ncbi:NUDIX domain-containing protein [Croceibacterium sp. TMG7-5b_MA50]|uniref:(deoxy)nucleoside triphosphate pyrophosphohydrolase n=1 Tax=Croceibacterium sp. TMG7-5b_MA50 TaxID=3121290 RepID=UPI003221FCC1
MPGKQAVQPPMLVVALCLRDGDRLLLAERPPGKHHGGLWEFPGGKVEPDERPRAALVREIAEELFLRLDAAALIPTGFAEDQRLLLLLFAASHDGAEVRALEGQRWGWFTRAEAADLPLAPLDRELLSRLH